MAPTHTLHPYQRAGAEWIGDRPASALLWEMGTGKTLTTLTALDRMDARERGRVLLIAPVRVAEHVWPAEVRKWGFDLSVAVATGSAAKRTKALDAGADITTIGRDVLPWLAAQYTPSTWPFRTIVLDELSSFKNPQAKRFKVMRSLRKHSHRVIGLTGTPTPQGLMDLWAQLFLLDGGERLGRTLTAYRERWFLPDKTNGKIVYTWRLRAGAEQEIQDAIADLAMSLRAKDVLHDLPKRLDLVTEVHLSASERKAYDRLAKDAVLPIADNPDAITAANAAVIQGKLSQLASGRIYADDGETVNIHRRKTEALKELIDEAQGEPVMVFFWYKHDLEAILEAIPICQPFDGSTAHADAWNRGEVPVLALHPRSAGHGLNLQEGGHIGVWYSMTWDLEAYQQASARLHRQGQTSTVMMYHLVTKDTVDEAAYSVLQGKAERQEALMEALRMQLEGLGQ